jgi:hypothetical protein
MNPKCLFLSFLFIVSISLNNCDNDPVKIALETCNPKKGIRAVEKLTDQVIIAKVALESCNNYIRKAAVEKLTDQVLLTKIVMDVEDSIVSYSAIKKLTDPNILMMINAFNSIPKDHRNRLMTSILPVILTLNDSEIKGTIGEIVSISTEWKPVEQEYAMSVYNVSTRTTKWSGHKTVPGEKFKCSIELKNLTIPLSKTWVTTFPNEVSDFEFRGAGIKVGDLLEPIFESLSQTILEKIALYNENFSIRESAINKLVSQFILSKIAVEEKNIQLRKTAISKLTDEALLKIMSKDKDIDISFAADQRLDKLIGVNRPK